MMTGTSSGSEQFLDTKASYRIELEGPLVVVENVPARVDVETGERLFSPQTVHRLQDLIRKRRQPSRVIETPVYDYV